MRYRAEWSGDGRKIAFSDKDGKVYILTVANKQLTQIARLRRRGQVNDYEWSPKGIFSFQLCGRERISRRFSFTTRLNNKL
jgi:WD40 repeat protein